MFTVTGMNGVALTVEHLQGDPTVLESVLFEAGKQIESIAKREMEWGKFRKPVLSSRKPLSSSTMMDARWRARRMSMESRIRISRLTPDSVSVSMPRELVPAVAAKMPEIIEFLESRIREILTYR